MKNLRINNHIGAPNFTGVRARIRRSFLEHSHTVHTESWQGIDITRRPEAEMHELMNVCFTVPLWGIMDVERWQKDIKPNLPWADDHFEERVCGYPINPGHQWKKWPWGLKAQESLGLKGIFNHNYMERYWPKFAGSASGPTESPHEFLELSSRAKTPFGIRGPFGDLNDVVRLLADQPLTRQAWMPVFFPEDTGIGDGGRKPCSLGYQFMVREGSLHIYYPLRSCDFYRHWADDVYLTIRLALWVIGEAAKLNPYWETVKLGSYTMHCTSLHMFKNDYIQMKKETPCT